MKKQILGLFVIIASLGLLYFITTNNVNSNEVKSIQSTELEVVRKASALCNNDSVVITVCSNNGSKYTLPKINAEYVEKYNKGSMIPVHITTFENNNYNITIDTFRLI